MSPILNYQIVPVDEVPEEVFPDKPVILVVDDEPLVADTLATILTKAGYAANAAYSGAAALELAHTLSPRLLITDVAMPEMDGVELALALVSLQPACKVLLFSGHATRADLALAQEAGYDFPLLTKPVHPVQMLQEVSQRLQDASFLRMVPGRIAKTFAKYPVLDFA